MLSEVPAMECIFYLFLKRWELNKARDGLVFDIFHIFFWVLKMILINVICGVNLNISFAAPV